MPLRSTKDYSVGIIYFILFILTIPAMNWVVMNVARFVLLTVPV